MSEAIVKCKVCLISLDEFSSTPPSEGTPCPVCGSLNRHVEITLEATTAVHAQIAGKARPSGGGKPFLEFKVGDDLHRLTGRWNHLERRIDRANDRYDEVITYPATGEILREVHEPLREHQGHGSDKARDR